MTLHIPDLARIVAKETGQPLYKTEKTLWAAFDALAQLITKGDEDFSIPNFGTFSRRERPATSGRNIHTGQAVTIPARHVAYFKPTGRLITMVRSGDTDSSIRKPGPGPRRKS